MNEKQIEIIRMTKEYVKEKMQGEASGHDWWHVYRVNKLAITIAQEEKADPFIVAVASLMHDIADHKFHNGDCEVGPRITKEWLEAQGVERSIIEHVCEIIKEMSFKGAKVKTEMKTIEGKVVQDADRLDAIGAIGIGRTFSYGGNKGKEMYNPEIKPVMHETFEQYKNNNSTTINHFYEKLLLLKDLMNTQTAKRIAEKRHRVMVEFLETFSEEWEGRG